MPQPDLETLTSGLFAACDETLGDTITIAPPAAEPITLKVHASHRDTRRDFGLSAATVQDASIDCDASSLPGKPDASWRITLPRVPGKTFSPRDVERDESGFRWVFGLKEVTGG